MDIVFGVFADGGAIPDHGGGASGALGAPVVGPNGLLDLLETVYGLSAPPTANVVRIAAWQTALAAVDHGTRFWSSSFAVDAWSSARTLLSWRDGLIDAGWDAARAWPAGRLADLAAAETAAVDFPAATTDRIRSVASAITPNIANTIQRLRLIDERKLYPCGWRKLIAKLEEHGVVIEQLKPSESAPAETALGQLQRWMLAGLPHGSSPDGSLTMATASSSVLAAEIVGQWSELVSAGPASVALLAQDGDTQLLDHGLAAAGQPRAGRSRRSPHRGTLQLLLLGFKTSWSPFDPHALMELLMFARSPIAGRAASRLARALEEAPGRGSEIWTRTWTEIREAEEEAATTDKEMASAVGRLARWRAWAEPALSDPVSGMTTVDAAAICDRTVAWALSRHANDPDPLYLATASLSSDVRRALVALDRPRLPRTLIERIIDQALDTGHDNPAAIAEAANWRTASHPGAIWAAVDQVVWWDFKATAEGMARQPWTQDERKLLASEGCVVDDPALAGQALSAAWERAILNCRERLLLVSGGLEAHDEAARHPVAHRIAPALETSANLVRLEDALSHDQSDLAGQSLVRVALEPSDIPSAKVRWTTPAGYAARLEGRVESATSFENLLSCQLKWALNHVAGLRLGKARSIPDQNRLLGNLAHALARIVFKPGPPPSPKEAAERTRALLDVTIDEIAAPLRHPALASDLAHAERRLPAAMAALAESLSVNGLVVEATELQVSGDFEEALAVHGAIDLVARDSTGDIVIVDLKWTRKADSRVLELTTGNAVQLATYGAMSAGDAPFRAGYFMLNQRQFFTLASSGLIGRSFTGARTLPETWSAVKASWRSWREAAVDGHLIATGVPDADENIPAGVSLLREANCKWCDFRSLCRVRGLK
jgi:hypothetical protein